MIKKAVIPVAGLGTRLLPATKVVPKEMIPIVDVPMVELIVEEAVRAGIETIVFVTARHKSVVEDHFDYNYELEDRLERAGKQKLLEISRSTVKKCSIIAVRQHHPLGLGHAILTAKPAIGNEPFAILLGDDLIDSAVPCIGQLMQVYREKKSSVVGVMEVAQAEVSKYGIVSGDRISPKLTKVKDVVEKPDPSSAPSRLAIPGRYVVSPKIFDCLTHVKPGRGGEIQLTDGLTALAQEESLLAYEFEGTRYDTGDRLGYLEATVAYALKRPELRDGMMNILKKYSAGAKPS